MALMERPIVTTLSDGGKCWEHKYEKFVVASTKSTTVVPNSFALAVALVKNLS